MQIPLDQFEQLIDETILKRGLSYFKNGFVKEPEEITPGVFETIVEGSEDYTVRLQIKNNCITEYTCDCPYDWGPVCKHIAAVIFHLYQYDLNLKKKSSSKNADKKNKAEKKPKQKTIAEQVDGLLEKITHDELKQFIREKTLNNPPLRNIFLSSFAGKNEDETKDLYLKQVKAILRSASGRDGFIDWSSVRFAGKAVYELLDTAQGHFEKNNYRSAVFICLAIMEGMTDALQYADDSDGDIGGNIDGAFNLLYEIACEELPEDVRKLLFEYCLAAFEKKIYSGWDWHLGMLQLASQILKGDDEAQRTMLLLDKTHRSEYEEEEAQAIKYTILKNTKGEKEADLFIEQNLANPQLRREAIQKAVKLKQYDKAISIANGGIFHDTKDKPGLAMEWYDWLLKIAIAEKDSAKIIEYARFLFIDNFRHDQDYYQIMKNHVPSESWNDFIGGVINDIKTKKRWLDKELLASIYIKEEWWDSLLEHVKQNPDLHTVEHYEQYLYKKYPAEIARLYGAGIIQYINNSIGRNHYQTACRYLRRMVKLGARKDVDIIIENLRKEYPKRKALMEELSRV